MKWGEQKRVLRMIPGLEKAEFFRYGAVHRNTFINAPLCLDETWQLKNHPGVYLAGQIIGTEGYVEAAAGGGLVASHMIARLKGEEPRLPPSNTAHYGLIRQTQRHADDYQPSNITFAHLPPWEGKRLKKRAKYEAMAERSLTDLKAFQESSVSLKAQEIQPSP
jgi:methylenetetrahydrofolate--tRNA-(uracil-5-)-methyltransferase